MFQRVITARLLATMLALGGFASSLIAAEATPPQAGSVASAPPADPAAADQALQVLVNDLSHEDFARREEASRQLGSAGLPAVKLLAECLTSTDAEAAWRASEALESIAIQGDEAALAEVSRALSEMKFAGKSSIQNLLADLRKRRAKLRHDRSLTELRALGAKISGDDDKVVHEFLGGDAVFVEVVEAGVPIVMEMEAMDVEAVEAEIAPPRIHVLEKVKEAVAKVFEAVEVKRADPAPALPEGVLPAAVELQPTAPAPQAAAPVIASEEAPAIAPVAPAIDHDGADEAQLAPIVDEDDLDLLPEEPPEAIVDVEPEALDGVEAGIDFAPALDFAFVADPGFDVLLEDVTDGIAFREALIDQDWKGGDEGLALFADLPEVKALRLEETALSNRGMEILARSTKLAELHVKKVDVSLAALESVRKAQPQCVIYAVGSSMLGINADPQTSPCILTSVFYNSGAYEAGLAEGDEITHIDGREIKGFSDVTISVYHRQPGESLKVNYLRGGKPLVAEVKLKPREILAQAPPGIEAPPLPPIVLPAIALPHVEVLPLEALPVEAAPRIIIREEEEKLRIDFDE